MSLAIKLYMDRQQDPFRVTVNQTFYNNANSRASTGF